MSAGAGTAAGAVLATVLAAVLWGTTGTAQALGPVGSDPASMGALRIAVGAAVLLVLQSWWRPPAEQRRASGSTGSAPGGGRRPRTGASLASRRLLVLVGGACVAAYQVAFFAGVARAGVAVGTVVALGVAPVATGLLGLLLGERPGRRWVLATVGAVAGVVLLVLGSDPAGEGIEGVGVLAAVGAGLSYAGYTVSARSLLVRGERGMSVMAGFFAVGGALLLPVLLLGELRWVVSVPGVLTVAWLGVVATGLAYALFQHGLRRLTAGTVGTLSLAEPVTATLLGVLLLGERLSPASTTGVVVVVVSLALVALPRGRRGPAAARLR